MKWSPLLVAGAPVFVLQFAVTPPAQASAALLLEMPLASVSGLTRQIPAAPVSCPSSFEAPFGAASKASAILGGAPSKLDLISLRQSAEAAPPRKLQPAAGGFRCQQAAPAASFAARGPGANPDDFLGSARLPLRKTTFDAQWSRVRGSGLPARVVAAMASPGRPTTATLAAVNAWSNGHIRYKEDRDLYGKGDYWANAGTTLSRRAGDCEDIAIFKMQALAALGVPSSDMYLTVARDLARNADHAVLVVKLDGRYWLLDNATDNLLDASASNDYRPIMSFSAAGKWLHGYARESAPRLVAMR